MDAHASPLLPADQVDASLSGLAALARHEAKSLVIEPSGAVTAGACCA